MIEKKKIRNWFSIIIIFFIQFGRKNVANSITGFIYSNHFGCSLIKGLKKYQFYLSRVHRILFNKTYYDGTC